MSIVFLALAAVASPASPELGSPIGNIEQWIRDSDYSSSADGGAVRFKVVFTPSGAPETCVISATTGNAAVEKLICSLVFKRFGFAQSRDPQARPSYRVFERAAGFEMATRSMPPKIATPPLFSFKREGISRIQNVSVVLSVDEKGALTGCSAAESRKQMQILADAACQAIPAEWKPLLEVNASGDPISYVRDGRIEFQPQKF